MTIQEQLKNLVIFTNSKHFILKLKKQLELRLYVESFIQNFPEKPISTMEAIYLLYNDTKVPICECGEFKKFYTFDKGYRNSCGSKKCIDDGKRKQLLFNKQTATSESIQRSLEKQKSTMMNKYGVEFPFQAKAIQEAAKNTLEHR